MADELRIMDLVRVYGSIRTVYLKYVAGELTDPECWCVEEYGHVKTAAKLALAVEMRLARLAAKQ